MRTPADAVGSRGAGSLASGALHELVQALVLPVDLVHRGDIVSIGQRFYRVDSVGEADDRSGFRLITLRSLETGATGAIEFRNADDAVSVLRFPAPGRRPIGPIRLAEPVEG